jgi:hypothetical protein
MGMSDLFSAMMETPEAVMDETLDRVFTLTPDQIRQFQDHWVAKRFADLRPRVAMLDKLAKEQGIDTVACADDAAPLLLAHTVYKSYPMSYLENYEFDRLTKWLSGLTATDLSRVDGASVGSIDEWLDELEAKADLLVTHSSGTTGKLSFLPRTREQSRKMNALYSRYWRDFEGPHSGPDMLKGELVVVNPGYRHGAGMAQRMAGLQVEMFTHGNEDNILFLYPNERLSADVLSLSGRINTAEARGELASLKIPQALQRRREEFIEREKERPQLMSRFLDTISSRFAGKDVWIGGSYGIFYDWALEGLSHGHRHVFGPNSYASIGGGKKGRQFPDGWRDTIEEFFGFPLTNDIYAMSEITVPSAQCSEEKYHFPPMAVPYLLDPKTGALLPRKDGTTGRLALFDIMPENYWAGLISGDEVTAGGWEKSCACGRTGFYVDKGIRRYSEKEGGDDKLMGSGAPEAHASAIAFLVGQA